MDKRTTFKIINYEFNDDNSLAKHAAEGHDPDFLYIWVRSISAGEFWGSNKNSDYFPEVQLKEWHHTFLNAHVFKNHENKEVEKAIGDVLEVKWNDTMKFVELFIRIDRKLAPEIVRGFEKGFITDVSMGCRVSYTQCSYCGNKAKTRAQFCDHVRTMRNQLMPNGLRVYEINYEPKFHDISVVLNGADRTAKVLEFSTPGKPQMIKSSTIFSPDTNLEKVASFSEEDSDVLEDFMKTASYSRMDKIADIKKTIVDKFYTLAVQKRVNKSLKNVPQKEIEELDKKSDEEYMELIKEAASVRLPRLLNLKNRLIQAVGIGAFGTYEQNKRMRGEHVGPIGNFVADNSNLLMLGHVVGAPSIYRSMHKGQQKIKNFVKADPAFNPVAQTVEEHLAGIDETAFNKVAYDYKTLNNEELFKDFSFSDTIDVFQDFTINKRAMEYYGDEEKLKMVKIALLVNEMGRDEAVDEIKTMYKLSDEDLSTFVKISLDTIYEEIEKEATFVGSVLRNMTEDNLFARPGFTAAALPATILDGVILTKMMGGKKKKEEGMIKEIAPEESLKQNSGLTTNKVI